MKQIIQDINNLGYTIHLEQNSDLVWDMFLYRKHAIKPSLVIFRKELEEVLSSALNHATESKEV